jgi:hypothetical protein
MLDERRSGKSVVTNTVVRHPRIEEREGRMKTRPKRSSDFE